MKKRLLSLLLVMVMVMVMALAAPAYAEAGEEVLPKGAENTEAAEPAVSDGTEDESGIMPLAATPQSGTIGSLSWDLSSAGVLTVSGSGAMPASSSYPWGGNSDIIVIVIEDGVTSISESAFAGLTGVSSVDIADSVKSIGKEAFKGCTNLESFRVPGSVTSIDYTAFVGCTRLAAFSLSSVSTSYSVQDGVLFNYAGDILVLYPNGKAGAYSVPTAKVKTIADGAFYDCDALTEVTIPVNVTKVGKYAFAECDKLESINYPESLTDFGSGWCANTPYEETLESDQSAFVVANGTLTEYKGTATEVTIPEGVLRIADGTFAKSADITKITIPASVKSIGEETFSPLPNLTAIEVAGGENYASVDGVLFNYAKKVLVRYPIGKTGAYTIPGTVTSVGPRAFEGCYNMTKVTISSPVATIGASAFAKCTGLKEVSIPNSVTSIGEKAFESCGNLKKVTFGNRVTEIGAYAFCGAPQLTTVTIPAAVTKIGKYAFGYIYDGSTPYKLNGVTIKGYTGSVSESYANENGFSFVPLGDAATSMDTPKLTGVSNVAGGVKITWDAVEDASLYRVFCKVSGGEWTKIKDTASTSYTWKGAESGTEYSFTVRCRNADNTGYTSSYDKTGLSITYIAPPENIKLSNTSTGVQISWDEVPGAELYRVYIKKDSKWTSIGDATVASYLWANAVSGTEYTFTVRCLSADGKSYTSGYDTKGATIKYQPTASLAAPVLRSVESVSNGVQLFWNKVSGAEKYRVFYKTDGGWITAGDTADTNYIWTGAKAGTTYSFTVRCINAAGKFTSSYESVKTVTYQPSSNLATPVISSVSSTTGGIQIKWGAVSGAAQYRVFYKTKDSGWKKIGNTTATSYTWANPASGTYTFTVRCLSTDGKSYTSSYDNEGKSITYTSSSKLETPTITSLENTAAGIQIRWGAVSGAALYRVYYRTETGWQKIADTKATNYTWAGAKGGTTYTFTVRCRNADNTSFTSDYDSVGKTIKATGSSNLATPTVTELSSVANGVQIRWNAVSGAAQYRVFYKSTNGWTKVGDTASTSYVWTGAKTGVDYTFTVRCLSADGKSYTSAYDKVGKSITYRPATSLATPVITSVSNTSNGVQIKWGAVSGAERYRVFYKTDSGTWTKAGTTSNTSYVWTGAKAGTVYTFTVRCLSGDNKSYTSDYDKTGKSITYEQSFSLATPIVVSAKNTSDGVQVTWEAVKGAEKYRVFCNDGSGWTKVGDTTNTSFTWAGAESGTTYKMTVRCISADGKTYTSNYDAGVSVKAE